MKGEIVPMKKKVAQKNKTTSTCTFYITSSSNLHCFNAVWITFFMLSNHLS